VDEEFEHRVQNFELSIHYVVKQKVITQGIKMSRGVELVFVTRQKNIILPKAEPTLAKGVPMAIRVKYSNPNLINKMEALLKGF
jgi:hypothetical protein